MLMIRYYQDDFLRWIYFELCPHHRFYEFHQLDTFYNGLNPSDQDSLNSSADGNLLERMPQDALKIIENKSKVCNSRNKPIVSQANASEFNSSEMAKLTDTVTQQTSVVTSAMTAMMKQLQATTTPASVKAVEESCVTCGGAHSYRQCPATDGNTFSGYQDNIQGYVSAAAVNYNQGNTGYRPQSVANQIRPPGFAQPNVQNNQNQFNQNQSQGFNQGNNYNQGNQNYQAPINQPQATANSDFSAYMKANDAIMKNMQTQMTSLTNSNIELKNMFGQFMKMNTASTSSSGPLPSNTIANPRGDLKAITTRSGVAYDGPPILPPFSSPPKVVEREPEVTKDTVQPIQSRVQIDEPVVAPKPKPTIPYPSRANKQKLREKDDNLASKFVEIFRELHFELSFADALLHMPKFASMFKSLLNNKEKLFELAKTPVNENCSAVILKKLPEKLGDPGKFLIPCDFPELVDCLALADLGASINLMPLSIWEKLSLLELTPTQMILELADHPRLDRPEFPKMSLTARALIDVYGEELTLRVDDEVITFKVGQTLRYSYNNSKSVNRIDVIDVSCEEYAQKVLGDFFLTRVVLNDDPSSPLHPKELHFEEIITIKSSINDPPELELKDLPSHLEYAFLEGTDKLPVIISKELKDEENTALLKVLKSHKRAIAWKISDIKGIDRSFCTHKILMEDDFKPTVQHQRRVNPKIHEVIKKEVIKLLDAGLIYPISDSPWVSPVHCVPKKGGGVFTAKKLLISSRLAIMDPPGDIMVPTTPLKRSLMPVSFGLLFTEMPMTWSHGVMLVNVKAKSRNVMKCLKLLFKFARSLTCGASILWDHSRLHEGTSIFSWLSTTCQNGLKRKRSPLTTPELL
ncbi:hypothetical protein Tco_0996368 [Tanacetum coccineum]